MGALMTTSIPANACVRIPGITRCKVHRVMNSSSYTPGMSTETLPRRRFLQGLSLTVLPGTAAALEPIPARADELRRQWADLTESYLDTLFHERPGARGRIASAEVLGEGLGALGVLKDFEQLDVETQTHPTMQALIGDIADAVAASIRASGVLLRAWLDSHGQTPDGEEHLRAALIATRFTVRDWRCSVGNQQLVEHSLVEMTSDDTSGALRRRVRRQLRRLERLEGLAGEMSVRDTGLLTPSDPALTRRVHEARLRWGAPAEVDESQKTLRVLGILMLGLVFAGGVIIAMAGICGISCGDGPAMLLLGLTIMGLSLWAAIGLYQGGRKASRSEPLSELDALEDDPWLTSTSRQPEVVILALGSSTVTTAKTWTATAADVAVGQTVRIVATGELRSAAGWVADADGSGVAAEEGSLLPGAPAASLIGKIGEEVFFIGSRLDLAVTVDGRLWLGINRNPAAEVQPEGSFQVSWQLLG